jgi:PKD domain
MRLKLLFTLGLVSLALGLPSSALAAPANDDFANATVIDPSALPFSDVVDNTSATTEPGEPSGNCITTQHTVWYSITPTSNVTLRVDMSGSDFFDNSFSIYRDTGSGLSGLAFVGCGYFGNSASFHASANTKYYVQAGSSCCTSGGMLHLNVNVVPPPGNDDFANASVISPATLPFSDTESALAATTEAGEPSPSCAPSSITNSWWYSFTPTATGSFTATTGSSTWVTAAAYTGSGLGSLSEVGCRSQGGAVLTFRATAGMTYYLQISDVYGGNFGPITLTFDRAPQPIANFYFAPNDPSTFDVVQFFGLSTDPGQAGFASEIYDFGDGTSAAGCCPNQIGGGPDATHRYAKDGDYTVTDTLTTNDGRTASTQQVVHVRTHDVSITKLLVPQTASVGQTRLITVGVSNKRYPETVQVQLMKSVAGGTFAPVGALSQSVPVRSGNQTTDFKYTYTFTSDDAALGKVTFEAIATIINARDALPADNTVTALPTKVNG